MADRKALIERLVAELRNPWQANPDGTARGPLPNWAHSLLSRAGEALASISPPATTAGEDDAEARAWAWLEQRFAEHPNDVAYGADEMVDAYIAGGGALTSSPDLREQVKDAMVAAYIAGAKDVHENWQEDRDPDFTEAAHDYARAALAQGREG